MWSAISRIFSKKSCNEKDIVTLADDYKMDRNEERRKIGVEVEPQDTYDTRQAKQRASIKWLLSKAYNNRVPENLREPFYRDHEDQEHLKPLIVGSLANAELYCLGLANIYSDPNYHNLNHSSIIQALARKGVFVSDFPDAQLTETVLIQTTPLKLSAHMAVIEALMVLYAKEVVTPDRVVAAIQRFSHSNADIHLPSDHEDGLLLWVRSASQALHQRVVQELESSESEKQHVPDFPLIRDFKDLCDGVSLAALVSFYCPEEVPWTEVVVNYLPTISNSVQNLLLVYNFCNRCLPSSVFHMMPEDVTYMQASMKHNLIVFLADLFNVLEIHPVKCVRFPGTDRSYLKEVYPRNSQGVAHKRSFPQSISAIPDLRSNLGAHSSSFTVSKSTPAIQTSYPIKKSHSLQQADIQSKVMSFDQVDRSTHEERHSCEEQFVVHRGRAVPTLSSVVQAEEPLVPARLRPAKEKQNQDTKAEERGEPVAAGRPSNWEDSRRSSYAGRRSRRNSVSDDSQLTLENFGGSQENLQFIGRNPDKEPAVHVGRKQSSEASTPAVAVRSSAQDARSSGVEFILSDTDYVKEKRDEEKPAGVSLRQVTQPKEVTEPVDTNTPTSFAELSRQGSKGIQIVYMQHEKENESNQANFVKKPTIDTNGGTVEKKTTFAALPNNTTTWQQQSTSNQLHQLEMQTNAEDQSPNNHIMASQLHNVRMKLEEKRRRIESEKRRMEVVMHKQRQKVGKAAFLQAVSKEISEDVSSVEHKWLDNSAPYIEDRKTPDIENMDMEQYQQSIAQMNSSLHEIQADIQRLESQQNRIKDLTDSQHIMHSISSQQVPMQNVGNQQMQMHSVGNQQMHSLPNHHPVTGQFYLHDQMGSGGRRTWAQQAPPQHDIPPTLYQEPRSIWTDTHRQQKVPQNMAYGNHQPPSSFVLHDGKSGFMGNVVDSRYHNGDHSYLHHGGVGNYSNNAPFQLHQTEPGMFASPPPQVSSPQHRINQLMSEPRQAPNDGPTVEKNRGTGIMHAPIPTPPVDDMEPQSISFIGAPNAGSEDGLAQNIKGLHITSGSRTYRIPSPTRPTITRNAFQKQEIDESSMYKHMEDGNDAEQYRDPAAEKGFYISFDGDSQPKRPKPPLRVKRSSPKKERAVSQYESTFNEKEEIRSPALVHESQSPKDREHFDRSKEADRLGTADAAPSGVGLIIGTELFNPDPVALDEMEKKKERIMLLSLQRRQQQEELKQYKEQEAQRRRELEKLKQEERERKKEEERLRRAAILEQYKLKKAIEEAEREGKLLPDKSDMPSTKPVPKMRNKSSTTRPRPKTIHVDSSAVDLQEGVLSPSRSKKGSTSNLTETVYSPNMRRDYYRGSQDSLAERYEERRGGPASLFRDSPDDGRGASPCRSVNQLGRRGSYKTSRDVSEPGQVRGRQKYPSYQGNFRGRKSNSLMNLSGSSTDQDSIVYRYTDTDSGLGRATPPRRAPSPGMSGMRHLPSPSGPGSLPPGLMSKRRIFDDGSSDISSTPSSMMEYTGPRLYKQPATKSNRGIMLNAVEYCVFPGVVNKEAKRRVLEEIARSESKHFLILFRDAGCQFRALYSYCPDREEVSKLYGTGPKQVNDRMFDKFFKYNSGGKCFSQVHTKHLTVTIDAFTIHNSLWQGKKVALPNKKDMALVI